MAAPMEDNNQVVGVINVDSDEINGLLCGGPHLLGTANAEATIVVQPYGSYAISKTRPAARDSYHPSVSRSFPNSSSKSSYDTITGKAAPS